jgi:hypothetical protein
MCDSFLKTRKYEQVYREDYRVFEEAGLGIKRFIDDIYQREATAFCPRLSAARGIRKVAQGASGWGDGKGDERLPPLTTER